MGTHLRFTKTGQEPQIDCTQNDGFVSPTQWRLIRNGATSPGVALKAGRTFARLSRTPPPVGLRTAILSSGAIAAISFAANLPDGYVASVGHSTHGMFIPRISAT